MLDFEFSVFNLILKLVVKLNVDISKFYFFGVLLMVIALPFSKFLMSVSQLVLVLIWLADGSFKDKFNSFFSNKLALVFASVFFMHLLGLIYTSDFEYGLEDIEKKIPLFLIPLIFSRIKPFYFENYFLILLLFVSSVFVSSLMIFLIAIGVFGHETADTREAFVFISHIRFSLMLCFSIFISCYFYQKNIFPKFKYLFLIFVFWFLFFMLRMELLTGIAVFSFVLMFLLLRTIFKLKEYKYKMVATLVFFSGVVFLVGYLFFEYFSFTKSNQTKKIQDLFATSNGELYIHYNNNTELENGNFIWHNIAPYELRASWGLRSKMPIDSLDLKGNQLFNTLIRYITSKGLRKDGNAIVSLSAQEIKWIENGIVNNDFQENFNFRTRVKKVIWEIDQYKKGNDFNGHSVTMRLEFWKAAVGIVSKNLLMGVGTGDVKNAYIQEYDIMHSPLTLNWRLRSHNQYLAIAVAFGLIGLVVFLFSLFFPFSFQVNRDDYFFFTFFIISICSMLNEDTLETQAGVTFFAFFTSFLLFLRPIKVTE